LYPDTYRIDTANFKINNFTVVSVSLPDAVNETFDTVTSMNMVDDVEKLQKFQTAKAI